MSRYIYAVQYGAAWRFRREDWRAFCKEAAKGEGWNLDKTEAASLTKLPAWWRVRNDVRMPLNWTLEDFAWEAENV